MLPSPVVDIQAAVSEALNHAIAKIEDEYHKDIINAVTDWAEEWIRHHHDKKAVKVTLKWGPPQPIPWKG